MPLRRARGPIVALVDDTSLPRTGKKVPGAYWQRDLLSPPFHVNLLWGHRFLQMGLLFPWHQQGDYDARGLPVRFEQAPVLRKPGKRGSKADWKAYREEKKTQNLSTQAVSLIRQQRQQLDQKGAAHRRWLVTLDGSYCNRTLFRAELEGVTLLARCPRMPGCAFPLRPASAATTTAAMDSSASLPRITLCGDTPRRADDWKTGFREARRHAELRINLTLNPLWHASAKS